MTSKLKVSKLVLSSDFSPKFLNFWPIVSQVWNLKFGIQPELALVYQKNSLENVLQVKPKLEQYGKIHYLEAHPKAPIGNQAKLARYFIAARYVEEFCMVDDLDTAHVQSEYLVAKFDNEKLNTFIGLGKEVYEGTPHFRNFPAGNFSGPGYLFRKLFNAQDLEFKEYVEQFKGIQVFSPKEDPFNKPSRFSDEYLISALFEIHSMRNKLNLLDRSQNIDIAWLDRSWWLSDDEIRKNKSEITTINFLRPLIENQHKIQSAMMILEPRVKWDIVLNEKTKIPFSQRIKSRWVAI